MVRPVQDDRARRWTSWPRPTTASVKIVKVNVDHNRSTAMKYHVRSIPMLLLFKNGQVQATQIGAVGKAQLAQLIDKAL